METGPTDATQDVRNRITSYNIAMAIVEPSIAAKDLEKLKESMCPEYKGGILEFGATERISFIKRKMDKYKLSPMSTPSRSLTNLTLYRHLAILLASPADTLWGEIQETDCLS